MTLSITDLVEALEVGTVGSFEAIVGRCREELKHGSTISIEGYTGWLRFQDVDTFNNWLVEYFPSA